MRKREIIRPLAQGIHPEINTNPIIYEICIVQVRSVAIELNQ